MSNNDDIVCPKCGNVDNFHFNYDYSKKDLPVENILCNECGNVFCSQNSNVHENVNAHES